MILASTLLELVRVYSSTAAPSAVFPKLLLVIEPPAARIDVEASNPNVNIMMSATDFIACNKARLTNGRLVVFMTQSLLKSILVGWIGSKRRSALRLLLC